MFKPPLHVSKTACSNLSSHTARVSRRLPTSLLQRHAPLVTSRSLTSSASSTNSGLSSVNADEIAFFSRLSSLWWDESGEYGQLHRMNPKRVEFISDKLHELIREEQGEAAAARMSTSGKPLAGLDILDVGCGGGLLSEVLHYHSNNTYVTLIRLL
jgi:hypothetical protein